jgi:hypothetical protein
MVDRSNPNQNLPPRQDAAGMQYFHHSDTSVAFRVRPYPDRLAAKSGDHTVTYGEFNQLANPIAWAISEKTPALQLVRLP